MSKDKEENYRKTTILELSDMAGGSLFWLFRNSDAKTKVNKADARRVKRITKLVKDFALNDEEGKFIDCKIEIGLKDMKYLKELIDKKFEATIETTVSDGLIDVLDAIEGAEDCEAELRIEHKKQRLLDNPKEGIPIEEAKSA